MRFLIDECVSPAIGRWLRARGHDTVSVYDRCRGSDDAGVITWAFNEDRILVTTDKGLGVLVYRDNMPHKGIVCFRLADKSPDALINALARLFEQCLEQLPDRIVVVNERQIRFARDDA